jgi:hypothetical protein
LFVCFYFILLCNDDFLVEQIQAWGGGVGLILSLYIWMGETQILWIPWDSIKDNKHLER